jgi:hypothetical protein
MGKVVVYKLKIQGIDKILYAQLDSVLDSHSDSVSSIEWGFNEINN